MKTTKLTYNVISEDPYFQKTVTATVNQDSSAFSTFEEIIRKKFEEHVVTFNHAGKVVVIK